MKIIDNQKLLKESKLEKEVDSLLEELGDAAAKPEGAVVEGEPELEKVDSTVSAVEKDLEADHAEEAEEVSEVEIKESADGDAAAKPEGAVADKEPELEKVDSTVSAVEGDLEADHAEEAEEVSEVIVKEEEELEKADEEEKSELLLEPAEGASEEDKEKLEKAETSEEDKDDDEKKEDEDKKSESEEEKKDEDKAESKEEDKKEEAELEESFSSLLKLLESLNEEAAALGSAAAEVKATKEGEGETVDADAAAKAAEEHNECGEEAAEDVEAVEIKESADGDAAAKPEGAVVDKAPEEEKVEATASTIEKGLEADHAEEAEEVSEVVVKESAEGDAAAKPENVTVEAEPETKPADSVASEVEKDLEDDHAATVEDVVEVVVEAARRAKEKGRALKEDIARELRSLLEEEDHGDVKDMMGVGKDFADKEYDEDAAENSAEMNGSDEFEKYEDIQGDGADAALTAELKPEDLRESVKYSSLKEACMLDEDYFGVDTYTVDTAESKREKLTEQVSLLMAREALDPMYDELLKTSLYAQRLQEAIINKYGASASKKVDVITERESHEQ